MVPHSDDNLSATRVELEGFESESDGAATGTHKTRNGRGLAWVTGLLAALALLEAIPTALWARSQFVPVATLPAPVTPGVSVPETPLLASIPPCEAATPAAAAAEPTSSPAVTRVRAAASATAAVPQPIAAGLLSIISPLPLHVYARGRLVGTSEAESVMLPLGSQDLDFVNESVGYRVTRSVALQAGRKASIRIDPPSGTLHVNALPWAEVWIDNQRIGETPIGNLQVAIGTRDVVFRHPELGERRLRVLVTLKEPARASVDLRKP